MAIVYANIYDLDDYNEEKNTAEGLARQILIDDHDEPSQVWVNPEADHVTLNVCSECAGEYGDKKYCERCTEIIIYDNLTLINLYNALHEALIERNLEIPSKDKVSVIIAKE